MTYRLMTPDEITILDIQKVLDMESDAVANEGARLCRMFGMSKICRSGRGSVIYEKVSMHKG